MAGISLIADCGIDGLLVVRPPGSMSNSLPKSLRIAGIDFGTVRIGVAVADTSVGIAMPHSTCQRRSPDIDRQFFVDLIDTEGIALFVVGLPVHLDGRESQKSTEARQFGEWLAQQTGIPVEFFDERFTSIEADEILNSTGLTKKKRQARRDQLAAQIMLAAYLESSERGDGSLQPIE